MSLEEFAVLKATLAGFGAGAIVAGAIAYLLCKHFLSGYLSEKGKNLAT